MKNIVLATLAILCAASACALTGSGTEQDPYRITSLEDFDEFAQNPDYYNDHIRLETDIDLAGRTYTAAVIAWDPNSAKAGFQGTAFTGVFDGNSKTIRNLKIDAGNIRNDYLGLFGHLYAAQVKDLSIENAIIAETADSRYLGGVCGKNESGTIVNCSVTGQIADGTGSYYVGALCGRNDEGVISNCCTAAAVAGADYVGGLCAWSSGTISDCCAIGSVSGHGYLGGLCAINERGTVRNCYAAGPVTGEAYLGGLCGANYGGTITDCYATGPVSGVYCLAGAYYLGGLCGSNYYGIIRNCHATGEVSGSGGRYLGGLCGWNCDGTISNCYATGSVSGGHHLGGLCGMNFLFSTIRVCYATGDVSGSNCLGGLCGANELATISNCCATGSVSGQEGLGGLCSDNDGMICNCYATGSVSGYENVGGLCGMNYDTITTCYATGSVSGHENVGGLCGWKSTGTSFLRCFWDTQTSQMTISTGGTPKTTAEMQTQTTFTETGWDFVLETANGQLDYWYMPAGDYPKLWWQNPLPQDTDFSGAIDLPDLQKLCEEYLLTAEDTPDYRLKSDHNTDGLVDLLDFAAFANGW